MKFYELSWERNVSEVRLRFLIKSKRQIPPCAKCCRPFGLYVPPLFIKIAGTPLPDVLVSSPIELVMKDHVKQVIEKADLTGLEWLTPEVVINLEKERETETDLLLGKDGQTYMFDITPEQIQTGEPLTGLPLWHLNIKGSAKMAPENQCVVKEHCPVCQRSFYSSWQGGIMVDESSWDQCDFFRLVEKPGMLIVTEKVKNVFEQEGFTGVEFTPVEEVKDIIF